MTEHHANTNEQIEIARQRVKTLVERLTELDKALSRGKDDFASAYGPDHALSMVTANISHVSSQMLRVGSTLTPAEQWMKDAVSHIRALPTDGASKGEDIAGKRRKLDIAGASGRVDIVSGSERRDTLGGSVDLDRQ